MRGCLRKMKKARAGRLLGLCPVCRCSVRSTDECIAYGVGVAHRECVAYKQGGRRTSGCRS